MSVFNTPRREVNHDKALLEMSQMAKHRRARLQQLTEEAELDKKLKEDAELFADKDKKEEEAIQKGMKVEDQKTRKATDDLKKAQASLESRLITEGRKEMFIETIFEMVYNACWVDDSVKETLLHPMYETFKGLIETLNGIGLTVDLESNVSPFIANMRERVYEACDKAAARISEECCDGDKTAKEIDDINFGMTNDEINDLGDSLNDLGKEDIEELVKQKVLTVVQDEKAKSEAKTAEIEEVKSSTSAEDDTSTDTEPAADEADTDVETTAEEAFNALITRSRNMKAYRQIGRSLFECILMHNVNELNKSAATLESNQRIDQNDIIGAALQETVVVYTMLETLNTLGLCKFDNISTNKLCNYYKSSLR